MADWDEQVQARFATEIGAYFRAQDSEPSPAAAESTIRTNTELVPARAKQLLDFLAELGGLSSLEGLDVLEAGSGFGALATHLALTRGTQRVVGVDLRPDLIAAARNAVSGLGIRELVFDVDDMRELGTLADQSFDVAFANNALLYVTDRGGVGNAAGSFRRVLRPGGRLVIFQANRWRYRDPFHGTPLIHLLPRPVRRPIDGRLGRPRESDRVLLLSPRVIVRELRGAGFDEVRVGAYDHGNASTGSSARFSNWISVVGRNPGGPPSPS